MVVTKVISILSIIIAMFFCWQTSEAAWEEPQEIIVGAWGDAVEQFGFRSGDAEDDFPKSIIVLLNGDIWITDAIGNQRLKLYEKTGSLKSIVLLNQSTKTFPEYWFIGQYEITSPDGSVFTSDYMGKDLYARFSSTGQLLQTYAQRPLELGLFQKTTTSPGRFSASIRYPDSIYSIYSDRPFEKYFRDSQKNLYGIARLKEIINYQDVTSYQVHKYSECGQRVSVLNMPKSQYEPEPPEARDLPIWKPIPVIEYGSPIVDLDGNVYCWARTKTLYKILKWTWVDDPNVPTGPDAPTGLSVAASINGLYLTWTASPNDPGCVTGYEVARATSSGGIFSNVATVEKGVVKYNDTSATAGTTYYYKVRAKAGSEFSPYTTEVSGKR